MKRRSKVRGISFFIPLVVLILGLVFRVSNLEGKAYWGDEVYSSLRIFGYSTREVVQTVATGQPVPAALLQQFQQKSPNLGVAATVNALATEDAHLPPLYFVTARLWADIFGDSIVAVRSLSVFFSLLALPCFYWLAMELFGQASIARMMVILAIAAPIHLVYAQEARFYSCWLLTTAFSSACLLRALRKRTWLMWGLFSIALILNLYTQLLALITLVGYSVTIGLTEYVRPHHQKRNPIEPTLSETNASSRSMADVTAAAQYPATPIPAPHTSGGRATSLAQPLYTLATEDRTVIFGFSRFWRGPVVAGGARTPRRRLLSQFVLASGLAVCAFLPWFWIYWTQKPVQNPDPIATSFSPVNLIRSWLVNFSRLFIDFNWDTTSPKYVLGILAIATLACLAMCVWATYRMCRETSLQTSLFVLTLIGAIPLLLSKLALQGIFPPRYLMPSYLGIQLALAYWLGTRLTLPQYARQRRTCSTITAAVVGVGLLSCAKNVTAQTWWNKQYSNCNPAIVRQVNQTKRPLIISDGNGGEFFDHAMSNVLSLAHQVPPETQFQVTIAPQVPVVADGFSDRFVLTPSPTLVAGLAKQSQTGPLTPLQSNSQMYRDSYTCLWKVN